MAYLATRPEWYDEPQPTTITWVRPCTSSSLIASSSSISRPFGIEATAECLAHGLGLLVDLLEHEVVVAGLLRRRGVPVDMEFLAVDRHAVDVSDPHAVAPQLGKLILVEGPRASGYVR